MEWQQLLGFRETARLGSFSLAALATGRSQPAVSQQVRALEKETGCRLFERGGGRGLEITQAGEKVLAFAERLLRQEQDLRLELEALQGQPRGRLRLAAPFTTLYQLLPPYLERYLARHPNVELTILDRPQAEAAEMARLGLVDLALCLESRSPAGLRAFAWLKVASGVLAPGGSEAAAGQRLSMAQLAALPLILPPKEARPGLWAGLEREAARGGRPLRVVAETANVELAARLVESGLGFCLATIAVGLPAFAGRNLRFLPLTGAARGDRLVVVCRAGRELSRPQKAFVDLLLAS